MYLNTHNIGWRVRTLRLRHGLSLVDVAARANLDISYISRLERDALQNAKPKPDTIDRLLDAINATPEERDAVYHIEHLPVTRSATAAQVREVAAKIEDDTEPMELIDDRWFVRYLNRAARAALALTPEEYRKMLGTHILDMVIDPENPRYSRTVPEDRENAFTIRAKMFRLNFANQEFDGWYRQLVGSISQYPEAARIWEHIESSPGPLVLERQDFTIHNPLVGQMRLRFQFNHLMSNPRFILANWTFLDTFTGIELAVLRTRPEFAYSFEEGLKGYEEEEEVEPKATTVRAG
jgi:transcriptional regulator with XRE-family HTH domain